MVFRPEKWIILLVLGAFGTLGVLSGCKEQTATDSNSKTKSGGG